MEALLNVEELAKHLKVSRWTIRAWCSKKYIPFFKLRGCVRFSPQEVTRWFIKNQSQGRSLTRLKVEEQVTPCQP